MVVLSMLSSSGYQRIDTSAAEQLISTGKVDQVRLLNNERMELDLKSGVTYSSSADGVQEASKVFAYYVTARGPQIVALLDKYPPSKGFTDQIDQPSWFGTLLVNVLPVLLLIVLFWFLMGQMQGGGNRVMQFGKSRAKLATKDMPVSYTHLDVYKRQTSRRRPGRWPTPEHWTRRWPPWCARHPR